METKQSWIPASLRLTYHQRGLKRSWRGGLGARPKREAWGRVRPPARPRGCREKRSVGDQAPPLNNSPTPETRRWATRFSPLRVSTNPWQKRNSMINVDGMSKLHRCWDWIDDEQSLKRPKTQRKHPAGISVLIYWVSCLSASGIFFFMVTITVNKKTCGLWEWELRNRLFNYRFVLLKDNTLH